MMINIAHVAPGLDVGGLEKLLVEIARHGDRRQFRLHFVSLGSRGRLADDIEALGWPVIALDSPHGVRPRLIWKLVRYLRDNRIDVLHTHDDRPLIYGAPAARLAGVPCIHTKHYGVLPSNTRRRTFLTNLAARCVNDFVCVSKHSADLTCAQGVPAAKIRTIWNGIDLARFPFTGPRTEGPIVTVARLSQEKGLDVLVNAAAIAARTIPDVQFQIAGQGPLFDALRQQVADLRLEKNVTLLGEVRDVPALLSRARMFVLPSLAEGISLTLLEAMSKGLPVVATAVGGNPEVVEDGTTGILVPPQDPGKLAAAVLDMHGNAQRAEQLGRAGRARVEQHFDICSMMEKYQTIYQKRIGDRRLTGSTRNLPQSANAGECGRRVPAPRAG